MAEKVFIPKDVAEAIEEYRSKGFSDASIVATAVTNGGVVERARALVNFVTEHRDNSKRLMQAIVNGYEIELTSEDKLRTYWEKVVNEYADEECTRYYEGAHDAILTVLIILEIEIKGVNV
jgi:hypothetical protein